MKFFLATISALLVYISLSTALPGHDRRAGLTPQQTKKIQNDAANVFAKGLGVTLGPRGRNIVLEKKFGCPTVTNDGITIAKDVELDVENDLGAALVKDVAAKTGDIAGSGYNTELTLALALVRERLENMSQKDQNALKDCLKK